MHEQPLDHTALPPLGAGLLPDLVDGLAESGWHVARNAVPGHLVEAMAADLERLAQAGRLRDSAIGKGSTHRAGGATRSDRVLWLPAEPENAAQAAYAALVEHYRRELNRELYLGLNAFEGHYASYGPGARYARHLDRFRSDDARVVSFILDLNTDWQPDDGGALRLYLDDERHLDVMPEGGTLVSFMSERFWHEVLPATRTRLSVTGWFLRDPRLSMLGLR